jgi:hypothetical protein
MLRMLFIGLPALLLVSGIPLALKLVPPNRFYGFRTSTTFSSSPAAEDRLRLGGDNRLPGLQLLEEDLIFPQTKG